MPHTGCFKFMRFFTDLMGGSENSAQVEIRRLASIGAPVSEVEEWIRTYAYSSDVPLMVEELHSLPPKLIKAL